MKKLLFLLMIGFLFTITSCEKETEGISTVTYYVNLTLNGDDVMFVQLGSTFTDPGCTAIEGETDVTSKVVVSGNVDVNTAGMYKLTYTATNVDGFSVSAVRTIVVCDTTCPVPSGMYSTSVVRASGGEYSGYTQLVYGLSATTFYVEDLMGAFYSIGRAYGSAYAAAGVMTISGSNISCTSGGAVPGWGDAIDNSTGTFDSATNTLKYVTNYAGMVFDVTMTLN